MRRPEWSGAADARRWPDSRDGRESRRCWSITPCGTTKTGKSPVAAASTGSSEASRGAVSSSEHTRRSVASSLRTTSSLSATKRPLSSPSRRSCRVAIVRKTRVVEGRLGQEMNVDGHGEASSIGQTWLREARTTLVFASDHEASRRRRCRDLGAGPCVRAAPSGRGGGGAGKRGAGGGQD